MTLLKKKPKAPKKTPWKKAKREKSLSALVKELDALVSRFVRESRADKSGTVLCYTCGKPFHWKKLHCGHYVSRFYKATRWTLDNLRPQCLWCNMFKSGDIVNFREKLVLELGLARVEELERARYTTQKLDRTFLLKEIERYKGLCNALTAIKN